MARGRFISLEGGEGCGKSTQLRRLAEALRARGLEVVETREPGGSPGAEAIRQLLLEGEEERWSAGTEALLFAAARGDHVARTILPALEARRLGAERPLPRQLARLSGRRRRDRRRGGPRASRDRQRRASCPTGPCCSSCPADAAAERTSARDAGGRGPDRRPRPGLSCRCRRRVRRSGRGASRSASAGSTPSEARRR